MDRGLPEALAGEHHWRFVQMLMQLFNHREGELSALIGLLVEEAESGDLVLVLGDIAGEAVDHGSCRVSACALKPEKVTVSKLRLSISCSGRGGRTR